MYLYYQSQQSNPEFDCKYYHIYLRCALVLQYLPCIRQTVYLAVEVSVTDPPWIPSITGLPLFKMNCQLLCWGQILAWQATPCAEKCMSHLWPDSFISPLVRRTPPMLPTTQMMPQPRFELLLLQHHRVAQRPSAITSYKRFLCWPTSSCEWCEERGRATRTEKTWLCSGLMTPSN